MKLSSMRPRFSIRTLMVLTTLLAIWCAYSMNWIRQRRELIATGKVFSATFARSPNIPRAPDLLFLFGERGEETLYLEEPSDSDVVRFRTLFPEAKFERVVFSRMGTTVNKIRSIPKQTP